MKFLQFMKTIGVALSLLMAHIAWAGDDNGKFVVKGEGNASCQDFVAAASESGAQLAAYGGFINGYTSAVNQLQDATFDVWKWQTIDTVLLVVLQRCRSEPSLSFGAAVIGATSYFAQDKIAKAADKVTLGRDPDTFTLYAPVAVELKEILARQGYADADIYDALMRYRDDVGLVRTPNLMQMLMLRLFAQDRASAG